MFIGRFCAKWGAGSCSSHLKMICVCIGEREEGGVPREAMRSRAKELLRSTAAMMISQLGSTYGSSATCRHALSRDDCAKFVAQDSSTTLCENASLLNRQAEELPPPRPPPGNGGCAASSCTHLDKTRDKTRFTKKHYKKRKPTCRCFDSFEVFSCFLVPDENQSLDP